MKLKFHTIHSSSLSRFFLCLSLMYLASCVFDEANSKKSEEKKNLEVGALQGVLTDTLGKPISGVVVRLNQNLSTQSDSLGKFIFDSLPTGEYPLELLKAGIKNFPTDTVKILGGEVTYWDKVLPLVPLTVTLKGKVVLKGLFKTSAEGINLKGIGIEVPNQNIFSTTNTQGEFVMTGVNPQATSIVAALKGKGWGDAKISVNPGESKEDILIEIDRPGGTVLGVVKNEKGEAQPGVEVEAIGGALKSVTDSAGRYRLENVPSNTPVSIRGKNTGVSGLIVSEGSQLEGVDLTPQKEISKLGVELKNSLYIVPDTGKVVVSASTQLNSAAQEVALYLWDTNNDQKYDTVTTTSLLTLQGNNKNQEISFGVLTTKGDSIGGATIAIQRAGQKPQVKIGQGFTLAPKEKALLLGEAVCKTGGIVLYQWDFDGDGLYDWNRKDVGTVNYRYYVPGTYLAKFMVTASSGEKDSGIVEIIVEGNPVSLAESELGIPYILSPKKGDKVPQSFFLSWEKIKADSFTVIMDSKFPPTIPIGSGIRNHELSLGTTRDGVQYFQVIAYLGNQVSFSPIHPLTLIPNNPPLITSTAEDLSKSVLPGSSYIDTLIASDPNGDPLTFTYLTGPSNLTLDKGILRWTPQDKDAGNQYIQVQVTDNQGGADTLGFVLTVLPSKEFRLNSLEVSQGVMKPPFHPDSISYTINLPSEAEKVHLLPVAKSSTASIQVGNVQVVSGAISPDTTISTGITSIPVRVVAADGISERTYRVNFVRRPSRNINLVDLLPSIGKLEPDFSNTVYRYTLEVNNIDSLISFTTTSTHSKAVLTLNGKEIISGKSSFPITLKTGVNFIEIKVESESADTSHVFEIAVTRQYSSVATLSGLNISKGKVSPSFSPNIFSYTDSLSWVDSVVTLSPITTHPRASLSLDGKPLQNQAQRAIQLNIPMGRSEHILEVKAEDGKTTQMYQLIFVRTNLAPIITGNFNRSIDYLETFPILSLLGMATDPDHDELSFSWKILSSKSVYGNQYKPNPARINLKNFTFVVDLQSVDWNGADSFFLEVSDPLGKKDTIGFVYSRYGWKQHSSAPGYLSKILFPTKSIGYILADNNSLWKTSDKGVKWVPTSMVTKTQVFDYDFIDENTGWAVGDQVFLIRNGAKEVLGPKIAPLITRYFAVDFVDSKNGWIGGEIPLRTKAISPIYRTQDGGETWQDANTTKNCGTVNDIQAISSEIVLVACQDGQLLRTEDGGKTWINLDVPSTGIWNYFTFGSSSVGFVTRILQGVPTLYRTEDAGKNWKPLTMPDPAITGLNSIHFVNADLGFMHCYSNYQMPDIWRTEDSGKTWKKIANQIYGNSIFGFDKFDVMLPSQGIVYQYEVFAPISF